MRGPSAEWDLGSDLCPAVRRTAAIVAAARHTDADKGDICDRFRNSGSLQPYPFCLKSGENFLPDPALEVF